MALNGLAVLKSALSKVDDAPCSVIQDHKKKTLIQMEGSEQLVNPISVVQTVIKEPKIEEQDSVESSDPPTHPNLIANDDIKAEKSLENLDNELVVEIMPETESEPKIELKSEHYEFDSESEFDNAALNTAKESKLKTEAEKELTRLHNIGLITQLRSTLQSNHVIKPLRNKQAILKKAHIPPKEPKAAKVGIIARSYAAKLAKAALIKQNKAVRDNEATKKAKETSEVKEETVDLEDNNDENAGTSEMENVEANTTDVVPDKKSDYKNSRRVQCTMCDKVLCHARSLRAHFHLWHGENNPVKCEFCEKQVKNAGLLEFHTCPKKKAQQQAAPKTKPVWYCQECSLHFPNRPQYKKHLLGLKHTPREQYKFECEVCNKRFLQKRWLDDHMDGIHLGLKKYSCDRCDSSYGSFSSLRRHIARDHEKQVTPKQTHICDLCGQVFTVKKSLDEHLLSHYGIRPYTCSTCSATFTYRAALYTHTRLKHRGGKREREIQKLGRDDDEEMDEILESDEIDESPEYLEF
ncbi:zinc finger protein 528-like [Leguminivora glycinivorella]|uniref:zinc finger protein 528-like n=1 Tax=Leguminivora glycinivorella TaxID=1035111 RepID=UPI00200FC22A|nr:zinc finger protein 528-like [Leguminivora glycinivorella]